MERHRTRKLCYHERDFTAGRSIVDNIVTCIGQSSRAIIVISRDFCASKWCQYEVQVALANMHKRRKGLFLVPIMLQVATTTTHVEIICFIYRETC